MRHDARTRRKGVRQMHEAEVLAGKQAAVVRQPAHGGGQRGISVGDGQFRPSPSHLGVNGVPGQVRETQELSGPRTVQGCR